MLLRNLPNAVLGLSIVALLGGCCTSGSCGSSQSSTATVYPEATYSQPASTDCGCGCAAASTQSPTYFSSESADGNSPYLIESSAEKVSMESTSPVVSPPVDNATSGFRVVPATNNDGGNLQGNLLPEN